ncbi:MAG: ankyrin repeat domain-containing protein [Kofleriaceae bacterium]
MAKTKRAKPRPAKRGPAKKAAPKKRSRSSPIKITLRIAAMRGGVALAKELLAQGADPTARESGFTPLHVAAMEAQMPGNHLGVARVLLDAGADVDARSHGVGFTPLFFAVGVDAVDMVDLLLERGADPRATTATGETPLHEAAREAEGTGTIARLLAAGVDPNARADDGSIPILRPAEQGHDAKTRALLDAGSDPALVDEHGYGLLHAACNGSLVEIVREMLSRGVDIQQRTLDGMTPLHFAVSSIGIRDDAPATVRLLIEHGADRSAKANDGRTPAELAFNPAELASVLP